jgi:hypothetical protein
VSRCWYYATRRAESEMGTKRSEAMNEKYVTPDSVIDYINDGVRVLDPTQNVGGFLAKIQQEHAERYDSIISNPPYEQEAPK